MEWIETFTNETKPAFEEISSYVKYGLWDELCGFIETTYSILPSIEFSRCSGAPGWNVKYKKSSRSLCTLYPNKGYFTCLISIGRKEALEAELMLTGCSSYLKDLYQNAGSLNGSRWLMIEVKNEEIYEDVKKLLVIRVHPPQKKKSTGECKGQIETLKIPEKIEELVDSLIEKDNVKACKCMEILEHMSQKTDEVYGYFDKFTEMTDNENSYVRTRGIRLIAANAKWDEDYKIDEIIDRYLNHITDAKPITSRQCIKGLPVIAEYKPELSDIIRCSLKNVDTSIYAESMRNLVEKDIREAAAKIDVLHPEKSSL